MEDVETKVEGVMHVHQLKVVGEAAGCSMSK